MNQRSSLLSSLALVMAGSLIESGHSANYGIGLRKEPFNDLGPILRDFKQPKMWGSGASYYKRPKNKATIARRKANKAARKARK